MKKEHASIYYFDDKDVFDALISEKSLTAVRLSDFLRKRGVLFSPATDRTFLCNYVATWFNDYAMLEELSLGIRMVRSRTRYTNEEMHLDSTPLGFSKEAFEAAVQNLKADIEQDGGTLLLEKSPSGPNYEGTWIREEIDWGKTPLRQVTRRSDKINFQLDGDGHFLMRTPADGACAILRDKVHAALETATKTAVSRFVVRLPQNATSEERISFFMEILGNTPGLHQANVTRINLLPEGEEKVKDDLEEAADDQNALTFNKVLSARLQGGQLIKSQEYQYLVERGFSPNEMRWWATLDSGEIVLAAAGFSNQERPEFFCNFLGIRRKSDIPGELKKTPESLSSNLRSQLMDLLENKAKEACKKLLSARGEPLYWTPPADPQ